MESQGVKADSAKDHEEKSHDFSIKGKSNNKHYRLHLQENPKIVPEKVTRVTPFIYVQFSVTNTASHSFPQGSEIKLKINFLHYKTISLPEIPVGQTREGLIRIENPKVEKQKPFLFSVYYKDLEISNLRELVIPIYDEEGAFSFLNKYFFSLFNPSKNKNSLKKILKMRKTESYLIKGLRGLFIILVIVIQGLF